ncbi:MAG: hypothetical protein ABSH51_32420 [Solirubrobacteraceae bacterium]
MARHPRPPARQQPAALATTTPAFTSCLRCERGGMCRSCAQRRKHAWRLTTVNGLSVEQAAQRMRLTPGRVRVLAAQERDYQELKRYKLDLIPTARVRAFLERELARQPELTRAELAHYLNMCQIDLDRQLGYEPGKNGRRQRHIGIPAASRLVLALGRAPHELDGC